MMSTALPLLAACSFWLVDDVDGQRLSSTLRGLHLKVSAVHLIPYIRIKPPGTNKSDFNGPLFEELEWLSRRCHFTYDISQVPGNRIGVKVNGTWGGIIGQLARNEVDLAAFPFILSTIRNKVVEHVGYYGYDRVGMLTRYPDAQVSPWSSVQPFTYPVWIGWIVTGLVITVSCILFVHFRAMYGGVGVENPRKIQVDMFLYILCAITAQGYYYRSRYRSLGVLALVWCFGSFVFVNVYSSTLTSFLAISYKAPEVNTMQALADNPNHQLLTIKGSVAETEILTAESGSFKTLGDRVRQCKDCRIIYIEELGNRVLKGGSIGVMPSASEITLIESSYESTKECKLTLAKERYGGKHQFMGVPKSSPHIEEIRRETLWAHASGLPYKWKNFWPDHVQCQLAYNRNGFEVNSQNQRLILAQFSPAFAILFIGYVISTIVFIGERCRKPESTHRKNQQGRIPV